MARWRARATEQARGPGGSGAEAVRGCARESTKRQSRQPKRRFRRAGRPAKRRPSGNRRARPVAGDEEPVEGPRPAGPCCGALFPELRSSACGGWSPSSWRWPIFPTHCPMSTASRKAGGGRASSSTMWTAIRCLQRATSTATRWMRRGCPPMCRAPSSPSRTGASWSMAASTRSAWRGRSGSTSSRAACARAAARSPSNSRKTSSSRPNGPSKGKSARRCSPSGWSGATTRTTSFRST